MLREKRYLVLKWSDIEKYLLQDEQNVLHKLITLVSMGRGYDGKDPRPEFVCVRNTWPEYEIVWEMIEDRVDNENNG